MMMMVKMMVMMMKMTRGMTRKAPARSSMLNMVMMVRMMIVVRMMMMIRQVLHAVHCSVHENLSNCLLHNAHFESFSNYTSQTAQRL